MSNPKAQSVRDRLARIAADRKEDFNLLLIRFASERFLYRLSKTEFVDRFVLKGASLFLIWADEPHRPTRDIDLLGFGLITEDEVRRIFSIVAQVDVESDGLEFDADGITVSEIREGEIYQGLQVKLPGVLGTARVSVQIDIGTGDIVTPAPEVTDYPTLLDFPAPRLKIYPPETVIAENLAKKERAFETLSERGVNIHGKALLGFPPAWFCLLNVTAVSDILTVSK